MAPDGWPAARASHARTRQSKFACHEMSQDYKVGPAVLQRGVALAGRAAREVIAQRRQLAVCGPRSIASRQHSLCKPKRVQQASMAQDGLARERSLLVQPGDVEPC